MGIEQDLAAIERRRQIADMLMQQGAQDIPLQTAGGMVVPVSPLQGISKIANMLSGAYIGKQANEQAAGIRQARMDALGNIDFNSPDAASQLAKAGFVNEAVKMRMTKAEKAQENRYQPTNMVVTDPQTGVKYLRRFGSLPGNEVTDTAPIPSDVQWLDTGSEFTPVPKQGVIPGQPGAAPSLEKPRYVTNDEIIDAVIGVESGGNPNAVSPKGATGLMQLMPDTAKNPGFGIAPVKDDSPEENIRVGSQYLEELTKKYGGDRQKAFAAYNWGTGNVDKATAEFGDSWMAHAPKETRDYVTKLDKLLGGGVIKKQLTPAQALDNDIGQQSSLSKAKAEAVLPAKQIEEQIKSDTKIDEVKQTEAIKNDAEIDKNRRVSDQKLNQGAEKGMNTLNAMYKYLYPDGNVQRDEKGRLTPPKDKMILGNSVSDRVELQAHDFGVHSDKASNLKAIQRLVNNMVLDKNNGSLGAGVSNADVQFLQKLQGVIENPQDPKDIYNAIADNEDSFKRLVGNSPSVNGKPKVKFMGFE